MHADVEFAPVAVEYVPALHRVQIIAPGVSAYVPAGQGVHCTPFGGFAYAPGTHVQVSIEVAFVVRVALYAGHELELETDEYAKNVQSDAEHVCGSHRPPYARKPALHAQSPKLVDPAAARLFAGQAVHADVEFAPVAVEYVFDPHAVQLPMKALPRTVEYVPVAHWAHTAARLAPTAVE